MKILLLGLFGPRASTWKTLLAMFLVVGCAQAQWVQTSGPWGPDLRAVMVSGNTLYAGTSAGVFVASNQGDMG